jgi:hypothetical protein
MARSCIEVPWAGGPVRAVTVAPAHPQYCPGTNVPGGATVCERLVTARTEPLAKRFSVLKSTCGPAAVSLVPVRTRARSLRRRPGSPRRPTSPVRSRRSAGDPRFGVAPLRSMELAAYGRLRASAVVSRAAIATATRASSMATRSRGSVRESTRGGGEIARPDDTGSIRGMAARIGPRRTIPP